MRETCFIIHLLIYLGWDVLLPVHLSEDPEGLEDNYSFTDGRCDRRGGGSKKGDENQPCGYEDINDWRVTYIQICSDMMYSTWT